jgi:flagellar biosynthesis anti-sigma factor FlgM
MRVSSKTGTSSIGATRSAGSGPAGVHSAATQAVAQVGDVLSVSGVSQFLTVARAFIAKVPDIRQAKVDAVRSKLASDDYRPDGEAVADGIVREYTLSRRNP